MKWSVDNWYHRKFTIFPLGFVKYRYRLHQVGCFYMSPHPCKCVCVPVMACVYMGGTPPTCKQILPAHTGWLAVVCCSCFTTSVCFVQYNGNNYSAQTAYYRELRLVHDIITIVLRFIWYRTLLSDQNLSLIQRFLRYLMKRASIVIIIVNQALEPESNRAFSMQETLDQNLSLIEHFLQ